MKNVSIRAASSLLLAILALAAIAASPAGGATGGGSPLRAGVYEGAGASPACVTETYEALRIDAGIIPSLIGPEDIFTGRLDSLDVIVFPGGSGSREYNSLGDACAEMVRRFVVEKGGGIVGICAGGYLVSDSKGYPCLRLIGAGTVDREHDKRGSALVKVSFTDEGLDIFPEMKGSGPGFIQYHDGPLFVPASGASGGRYAVLAANESDVHHTGGAPAGMTPGKPFLICDEAGSGRVFACAGHPESTAGMRWMVPRMVRWAARRAPVPYGPEVTRPQLGTAEIMHSDEFETETFWKLFADEPSVRMDALKALKAGRYRNGFRWAAGMIRDRSPEVRALAARILAEAEYTAVVPAMRDAMEREPDPECREALRESIERLESMTGVQPAAARWRRGGAAD